MHLEIRLKVLYIYDHEKIILLHINELGEIETT